MRCRRLRRPQNHPSRRWRRLAFAKLLTDALAVAVADTLPPLSPSPPAAPAPALAGPFSFTEVNVAVTLAPSPEYAAAMPRANVKGTAVRLFHLNATMGNAPPVGGMPQILLK